MAARLGLQRSSPGTSPSTTPSRAVFTGAARRRMAETDGGLPRSSPYHLSDMHDNPASMSPISRTGNVTTRKPARVSNSAVRG